MKTATGPENTGGNPKVSVPVHLHRPSFFRPFPVSCVPCLPSPLPFPHPNPHTPPTFNPASRDKALALPHEDTPANLVLNATHMLEKSEGRTHVLPQEDTSASRAIIAKHWLKKSEGGIHSPYEDTRASSARKISASHTLKQSEGHNTHRVRDVDVPISPLSLNPQPAHAPSRFASPNRFELLSASDLCYTVRLRNLGTKQNGEVIVS
jgi:hypothetical protein